MVLLDNSSFIIKLEKFAIAAKNDSSFKVTFKRCKFCHDIQKVDGHNKPVPQDGKPPLPEPKQYQCLIRAQTKSKKLSTVVKQEDVPKMMTMYAQFMRSNLDGLKRVKKIKSKAKAAKG